MISFWVIAGILLLVALAFTLVPLRRRSVAKDMDRQSYNQTIFQQKKVELERERAQGVYSEEEYKDALVELQRAFLDDVKDSDNESGAYNSSAKGLLLVLVLLVPIAAIWSYSKFSTGYQMLGTSATDMSIAQPQSIDQAIKSLIEHLQEQPQDTDAWKLLARTYFAQQEFAKALQVYEKINQITQSTDPDVLVGMVEASSYLSGNDFTQRQVELLQKALTINPNHERALWYAGYAAYTQNKYQQAVDYWQHLISQVPPAEAEVKAALSKFLADAKDKAGLPVADNTMKEQSEAKPISSAREIRVKVTIDNQFIDRLKPTDSLFVFARAADGGSRMPLALVRLPVSEWPVDVVLDEQQSMVEGMSLATFDRVQVVARVSRSGQATPQKGDLYGESEVIDIASVSKAINIKIKHLVN